MNSMRMHGVVVYLSLLLFVFLGSSCANEEYDMSGDNLNLEINPFEEGLSLPLGSTEQILLKDLLQDVDTSLLNIGENGAYSIGFKDSLDMTDELSDITDIIEIPDVDFSQAISFQLDDVDVSDIKVDATDYTFDYDISSTIDIPDLDIPSVSQQFEAAAGMTEYVPSDEDMVLDFEPIEYNENILSISDDYQIGEQINDTPIPLETGPLAAFLTTQPELNIESANVSIDLTLPEGINSVEEIILNQNCGIRVSIELIGGLLKQGTLRPDVDIDFREIFHLRDYPGGIINLKEDLKLSETNGYKNDAVYSVSSLNINSNDWTMNAQNHLSLNKSFDVPVSGQFITEDLMTTTRLIAQNRKVDVAFKIEFVSVDIDDVVMEIDPITISQENTTAIQTDINDIPQEIESIHDVVFTPESGLDINIKAQNIQNIRGLDTRLETIEIIFPERMIVPDADAGNKVILHNIDLTQATSHHITITGIELPAPENDAISFLDEIKVFALATASGIIHSQDLPTHEENDAKIIVDVTSALDIQDYNVTISGYEHQLDIEDKEISFEIPESVSDMDEIIVYPEGDPEITVEMNFPDIPLDIEASSEGVSIYFPKMLRFKDIPSSYNYDLTTNSITLFGVLPSEVVLPVEKLIINPELDPTDGKYYSRGTLEVSGGVCLSAGVLSKEEIDLISDPSNKVSVITHIPEIVPSTLDLDLYESSISQTVELEIMSPEDVPAEVESLGRVDLKDAFINITLDATSLPDLNSADLEVDLDVQLPDMIHVVGADETGHIKISGKVDDNGMINLPPMEVEYLDLTGVDIKKDGINGEVQVEGIITISNASLDVDEWLQKDLEVFFNAGMKDIYIEKLVGKVNYDLDPVVQQVDLSEFTSMLGDASSSGIDATLDFYHAHLILEVTTNLGVPVDADVELIPIYDGKPDEDKIVRTVLSLDPAESAADHKTTRYYLAHNDDRCPNGYKYVQANVLDIIKNVPDKLEFRLTANTDSERESILEPNAEYVLKANYLFELPLEFGEEFEVVYKTRISGLHEIIGKILSKGSKVKLEGTIENSLPLGLDLKINFLDSDDNIVPVEEGTCTQKIDPCGLDGSAVTTELDMIVELQETQDADIKSLELVFIATSSGVIGVPVTDQAYLQAVLQLVLPEGLNIDLKEFFNNEE